MAEMGKVGAGLRVDVKTEGENAKVMAGLSPKPRMQPPTAKRPLPAKARAPARPGPVLPAPLTEPSLLVAMSELPDGARRATETCYECFKERKFTASDFVSFLKSISSQAPTLQKIFAEKPKPSSASRSNTSSSCSGTSTSGLKDLFDLTSPRGLTSIFASRPGAAFRGYVAPRNSRGRAAEPVEVEEKVQEAIDMTAKLIDRRRREAKRRQLGRYPGNETQRWKRYLLDIVRRLGKALPASGKQKLQLAIQAYCERSLSPEEFQETLQNLVDEHAITIALEYTPEHEARNGKGKSMFDTAIASSGSKRQWPQAVPEPRKKQKAEPAWQRPAVKHEDNFAECESADGSEDGLPSIATEPSSPGCPACELGMFGSQGSNGRCQSCGKLSLGEQAKPLQSPRLAASKNGGAPDLGNPVLSSELPDTALGAWLTQQARRVCPAERNVVVKILAQEKNRTGGGNAQQYPYGMKAIFAFQKLGGREVIVLGMYVHEFAPDAPSPSAGRTYLECIDSIPLHGGEQSDERQKLLSSIIHGYLKFASRKGMKSLHLRVPPPSAENSYIFAYRNLSVRMEATLRMAQWYKRILETAKNAGVVVDYEASTHLSRLAEFPPCILPASDLAEEHAFSAMRSTVSRLQADCDDHNEASVLSKIVSFKDRFFVARLRGPDADELAMMDKWPLFQSQPNVVAGSRLDFIATCAREKLSFNSLTDSHRSTAILLRLMMPSSEQQSPRCVEDLVGMQVEQPAASKPADRLKKAAAPTPEAPAKPKVKAEESFFESQERENIFAEEAEAAAQACWEEAAADLGGMADAEIFADSLFSA